MALGEIANCLIIKKFEKIPPDGLQGYACRCCSIAAIARVACRQMGYANEAFNETRTTVPEHRYHLRLDNCTGGENYLTECRQNALDFSDWWGGFVGSTFGVGYIICSDCTKTFVRRMLQYNDVGVEKHASMLINYCVLLH